MCLFPRACPISAAETTTATNMAVFTALTPLLTVGLSAALLGEDPTLRVIAGAALSLCRIDLSRQWRRSSLDVAQRRPSGRCADAAGRVRLCAVRCTAEAGGTCPAAGWQSTYVQALCALAIMFPAFLATPRRYASSMRRRSRLSVMRVVLPRSCCRSSGSVGSICWAEPMRHLHESTARVHGGCGDRDAG